MTRIRSRDLDKRAGSRVALRRSHASPVLQILYGLSGLILLSYSSMAAATAIPVEGVELNDRGEFVHCQLLDGRELLATPWLVSIDHHILAKTIPTASRNENLVSLIFRDWEYEVEVFKRVCTLGSSMGAIIKNLHSPGSVTVRCREQKPCGERD